MADVTKEVKVKFTGDTQDIKRSMQEFKTYQTEMGQNANKISSSGIKGQKELSNIARKTQKFEKLTRGKPAVQAEKTLYRAIKKTTGEVVKRQRAYKSTVKHVEKLRGRMRSVTSEAKNAGRELKKAYKFFGGGTISKVGAAVGRGGAAAGRGAGGLVGGLLKGLGGALAGGIMTLVGGAIGIITGQLSGGYAERIQYGRAYGGLAGTGGRLNALNRQKGFGVRMGFGAIEMAQQSQGVARATGVVGGDALRQSMALQRSTTLGAGESAGFMGMLTQAGQGFGGKAGKGGKQELIKTLALGMYSGLDRARMPEFFAATKTLVQRQMGASAGNVSTGAAASLLAMLGASGQAGLQGARGGQVASALDKAIRKPGGGEAGQAFMLQAMGFGKPGGKSTYYEALKKQESGTFGEGNLEAMFSESKAQYGGGQAQILALRNLTGLTISQLESIRDVVDSNLSDVEQGKALKKIQEESKTIEEQALDEMTEFGDTIVDIAGLQNRSITIGDQIKKGVEKLRDMINEAVVALMPLVVKALDKLVALVENIWAYIKTWIDPQFSEEQKAQISKRMGSAEETDRATTHRAVSVSAARSKILVQEAEEARVFGQPSEVTTGRYREATHEGAERERILSREAAMSLAARDADLAYERLAEDLGEGGYTARESAQLSELSTSLRALAVATETQGYSTQEEAFARSQALIDAIDESRRNRSSGATNDQRGTTTPTRTGTGRN